MHARNVFDPNDFQGSDSARIAQALAAAAARHGTVRITRRDDADGRAAWLIDEAILLPGNLTLIIDNCTIQLSDQARDNFIRSANCGIGIADVEPIENLHILGVGNAVLLGAEHPRATGDAAKTLGIRSYGTDAGRPGEKQTGDWRNIGILLARVHHFTIENLLIREAHSWAISLEQCTRGVIRNLSFHATERRIIDGVPQTILNQDGLDLRAGCRDILIDTLTGVTGDDLLALTGICLKDSPAGTLDHGVSGGRFRAPANDIQNIIIRNVIGYSAAGHHIVRFLNTAGLCMRNIVLDGLIDTSPETVTDHAAIRIGDAQPAWGGVTPLGDTSGFQIRNVFSKARSAILVGGSLCDSVIDGVFNANPEGVALNLLSGAEYFQRVDVAHVRDVARKPAAVEVAHTKA
ncbi:MAG: hypothetical protein GX571_12920 [Lentisphaerae bacterium]|jgi:hypothetical protein|nr:hypothetical protein [Lentisphaerota bacterium]